jgi:hypothetical protein
MPKPLYVEAFEHFKKNNDVLTAYVAFGLYVDAECKWAEQQASWPTTAKYREWFDCSIPYACESHNHRATDALENFANNIVEEQRTEFLAAALCAYKVEAAKAHKGFVRGVLEATTGALFWSVLLIVVSIIVQRVGIDILETYERAAGTKAAQAAPPLAH